MPPDLEEVRRWLVKAERDRRMALAGLDQSPPIADAAGFHAQQSAEKLLKAFLVFRETPFEKIHDIATLLNACLPHVPALALLRDALAPLTAFAVRFRYPGPNDPTVEQVIESLKNVELLRQLIYSSLPTIVHPEHDAVG